MPISEITQKTLTVRLKELEEKNIILSELFFEVPPRVVYSLTPIGAKLKPVLKEMYKCGIDYIEAFGKLRSDNHCGVDICKK